MSDVINPDGSVISGSQIEHEEIDPKSFGSMIGIVVSVQPSDDPDNLSSASSSGKRGFRNECQVVIWDENVQSNMILENVVIPPRNRSNYDDYDEDLPVGIKGTLSQSDLPPNWKNVPISDLDGDMCVVQFIGGSRERPYISSWWPHTANRIDPATSGNDCLKQVDTTKQRSRQFRRLNGVEQTVTAQGDLYLSTAKAASTMDLSGKKPVRREVTKGGSIQVDVKASQQLEFNWNASVEGLKAGSNSQTQTREPALPHLDHSKATGTPAARGTDATILRFKKQEGTISTGKMVIYCHKDGGGDGFAMMTAEDSVVIGQGAAGDTLATISMSDGEIIIATPDGDSVSLASDKVTVATNSGASVLLQGTTAVISAGGGVSLGSSPTIDQALLGTTFLLTYSPLMIALAGFLPTFKTQVENLNKALKIGPLDPNGHLVPLWTAIAPLLTSVLSAAATHTSLGSVPPPASTWLSSLVGLSK